MRNRRWHLCVSCNKPDSCPLQRGSLAEMRCVVAQKPTYAEVKFFQTHSVEVCSKSGRRNKVLQPAHLCSEEGSFSCLHTSCSKTHKDFASNRIVPLCKSRTPFPILSCTCGLCLQSTLRPTSCRLLRRPRPLSACSWAADCKAVCKAYCKAVCVAPQKFRIIHGLILCV